MLTRVQINERLDDIWEFCNDDAYYAGLTWYPNARRDMSLYGLDYREIRDCNAVAIAAWNNSWKSTLPLARKLVEHTGGTLHQRRVFLEGLKRTKQPKSYDFAHALHGNTHMTPIDRWMVRAMGGTEKKLSWQRYFNYDWAFKAWISSRINLGAIPRTISRSAIQAVVWCVVRGKGD